MTSSGHFHGDHHDSAAFRDQPSVLASPPGHSQLSLSRFWEARDIWNIPYQHHTAVLPVSVSPPPPAQAPPGGRGHISTLSVLAPGWHARPRPGALTSGEHSFLLRDSACESWSPGPSAPGWATYLGIRVWAQPAGLTACLAPGQLDSHRVVTFTVTPATERLGNQTVAQHLHPGSSVHRLLSGPAQGRPGDTATSLLSEKPDSESELHHFAGRPWATCLAAEPRFC